VTETVLDKKTGIFFKEPMVESLLIALKQFNKLKINPKSCISQASKFSKEQFKKEFRVFVEEKYRLASQ
jgi:hypothetical protein